MGPLSLAKGIPFPLHQPLLALVGSALGLKLALSLRDMAEGEGLGSVGQGQLLLPGTGRCQAGRSVLSSEGENLAGVFAAWLCWNPRLLASPRLSCLKLRRGKEARGVEINRGELRNTKQ